VAEELYLICPNEAGRGLQKFDFTFDGSAFVGPEYRVRQGRDSQQAPVAQKIAHGHGSGGGAHLEREVSIGRTLARRIGAKQYPACISRLIGYNPGISDMSKMSENQANSLPYAVFTYQRGTLADLAGDLPVDPDLFWRIADGLIIALCYLQSAQVVHRRIRLDTVRWDGEHVQLADFTHAVPEWDAHPGAVGEAPWDAPEQRGGAATADCRDDIYAAALLLAWLATGQEFADDAEAREAIRRLDLGQRTLLDAASVERRRDRPSALELRRRRRIPDPLNAVQRGNLARESEARARFARLRAQQQRAQALARFRAQTAPADRAGSRARRPGWMNTARWIAGPSRIVASPTGPVVLASLVVVVLLAAAVFWLVILRGKL
jgi:serine/threonine protein kinase